MKRPITAGPWRADGFTLRAPDGSTIAISSVQPAARDDIQACSAVHEFIDLCEAVLQRTTQDGSYVGTDGARELRTRALTAYMKAFGTEGLKELIGDVLREADDA